MLIINSSDWILTLEFGLMQQAMQDFFADSVWMVKIAIHMLDCTGLSYMVGFSGDTSTTTYSIVLVLWE